MSDRSDRFAVLGQIGQDVVAHVAALPAGAGTSTAVRELRRLPGGKGMNQAVGLRQLGAMVALVGVVGDDPVGADLLKALAEDGIDTCAVARRGESTVMTDIVDAGADRMLLEYVPESSTLTSADVQAAEKLMARAGTVCLQAQQPGDTLLLAAELARRQGAGVALDGAPDRAVADRILALADVVRADAVETEALAGLSTSSESEAREACRILLDRGPAVVAVEVPHEGDMVAWRTGAVFLPHHDDDSVVDRTGAGDAFFAGLVRGLARGWTAERAADLAARAAASTVTRLGGRPDLTPLAHLCRV